MKKSQLRQIIRESIKQLMTEQSNDCLSVGFRTACSNQGSGMYQATHNIGYQSNQNFYFNDSSGQKVCHTINGQPITNANYQQYVGQLFTLDPSYGPSTGVPGTGISGNTNYWTGACDVFELFYVGYLGPYSTTVELNPASCGQGGCGSSTGTQVSGCTDSNAYNFDPNATLDDGSCDYGFYCKDTIPGKPGLFKKCTPANQNNPGPFETLQDCLDSGCEPKRADKDDKTIKEPTAVAPVAFDAQSDIEKTGSEDEENTVKRMQELANIKK